MVLSVAGSRSFMWRKRIVAQLSIDQFKTVADPTLRVPHMHVSLSVRRNRLTAALRVFEHACLPRWLRLFSMWHKCEDVEGVVVLYSL